MPPFVSIARFPTWVRKGKLREVFELSEIAPEAHTKAGGDIRDSDLRQ